MRYAIMETPVGPVTVVSTPKGLSSVRFGAAPPRDAVADEDANRPYIRQIAEYFDGRRRRFDLPLDLEGTSFQMAVWQELRAIPYGETRSYGDIARKLGNPGAARAVGMANHDNPIAVVVPCQRVIGSNGALTGYAAGLPLKKKLLSIEQRPPLFT
jgi:methylated-DNA-[protein]-cysteine S-methyltransferase